MSLRPVRPHVERRDGYIVLSGLGTLHFEARSHATLEAAEADARLTATTSPDVVVVLPAVLFKGMPNTTAEATDDQPPLDPRIAALVAGRFGGDYRAAFDHYDADADGTLGTGELRALLADAGIGSGLTRWARASGVMVEVDANGDGCVDWAEFAAAARQERPPQG